MLGFIAVNVCIMFCYFNYNYNYALFGLNNYVDSRLSEGQLFIMEEDEFN